MMANNRCISFFVFYCEYGMHLCCSVLVCFRMFYIYTLGWANLIDLICLLVFDLSNKPQEAVVCADFRTGKGSSS